MKQRNTGLHVGKYRKQPNFKTNLDVMVLPAARFFCALAGLLITVTGLTAILPLFASGFVCLALVAIAKHLRKESFLLPIAILILIIIVSFARATLLNGFAALWNETRDLWAAEKEILLPLAQTDNSGLWLAQRTLRPVFSGVVASSFQNPGADFGPAYLLHRCCGAYPHHAVAFCSGGDRAVAVGVAEKYGFRSQLSAARRARARNRRIGAANRHGAKLFANRQGRLAPLALRNFRTCSARRKTERSCPGSRRNRNHSVRYFGQIRHALFARLRRRYLRKRRMVCLGCRNRSK